MKRLALIVAALAVIPLMAALPFEAERDDFAAALGIDSGPVYVYWENSCLILEVQAQDGLIYGSEIGCTTPHVVGGGRRSGGYSLGYTFDGDPRLYDIRLDGTITIWSNAGNQLNFFNAGTWVLGPPPTDEQLSQAGTNPNW